MSDSDAPKEQIAKISAEAKRTEKLQTIMQQIAENNGFDTIDDPSEWQRQQRQDRLLPR